MSTVDTMVLISGVIFSFCNDPEKEGTGEEVGAVACCVANKPEVEGPRNVAGCWSVIG